MGGFLDDFRKQHVDVRAFIIGVLLITPMWYIGICLFHKPFFQTAPIYLPIVFSYCLTICFTIVNVLIAFVLTDAVERNWPPKKQVEEKQGVNKKENTENSASNYYVGFAMSIMIIAGSIFVTRETKELYINKFLAMNVLIEGIVFAIILLFILISWPCRVFNRKRKNL